MFIILLGSCFIAASAVATVPVENTQQVVKTAAACKCDSTTCNPSSGCVLCKCTYAGECKAKAQQAESAAVAQAAAAKETKCCSSNK